MFAQLADKILFEQAKSYAYMDDMANRPIFPHDEALKHLAVFDEPLPEYPQLGLDILKQLDNYGSPATIAQTGGDILVL